MDPRPEHRSGLPRSFAAFVLALFALGWIADRAHVAFESHAYCDEHQRIEHAAAPSSAAVHAHVGESADHPHDAPDRGPGIDALDLVRGEHATCCVLLARGSDPVAVPCVLFAAFHAPFVAVTQPDPAWGTTPRGSVPLLALAPKQSPPAT